MSPSECPCLPLRVSVPFVCPTQWDTYGIRHIKWETRGVCLIPTPCVHRTPSIPLCVCPSSCLSHSVCVLPRVFPTLCVSQSVSVLVCVRPSPCLSHSVSHFVCILLCMYPTSISNPCVPLRVCLIVSLRTRHVLYASCELAVCRLYSLCILLLAYSIPCVLLHVYPPHCVPHQRCRPSTSQSGCVNVLRNMCLDHLRRNHLFYS